MTDLFAQTSSADDHGSGQPSCRRRWAILLPGALLGPRASYMAAAADLRERGPTGGDLLNDEHV